MPILEAFYLKEGTQELIRLDRIESHPDFPQLRNSLYCASSGCSSRIEFVPPGKYKAYFKTWPKDNHNSDCDHYFDRERANKRSRSDITITVNLTNEHIKNILKDTKRVLKEKKEGTTGRKTNPNRGGRRNVDPESTTESSGPTLVPTASGKGEDIIQVDREKGPAVRKRTLQILSDEDVGESRSLYDVQIEDVLIDENVEIIIKSGSLTSSVYFEEVFFSTAPNNAYSNFQELRKIVETDKSIGFIGVGDIVKRKDMFGLMVYGNDHFFIDGQYILNFLHLSGRR